jgi:hypothetical protein
MKKLIFLALCLAANAYAQMLPPMPPQLTNSFVYADKATLITEDWVGTNIVIFLHFPEIPSVPFYLEVSEDLKTWNPIFKFTNEVSRTMYYFAPPTQNLGFFRLRGKSFIIFPIM